MPRVGEVVLFRIHDDPVTLRPLLVISEKDGVVKAGELFLDYEEDRSAEWVQKNLFYLPQRETRTVPVFSAARGSGLGQWREK